MTVTLVGPITDLLGHAEHSSVGWDGPGRAVEHRSYTAISSLEYRSAQPPYIAVDLEHRGRELGRVVHLERSEGDTIWAVAVVDGLDRLLAPSYPPTYWSPSLSARGDGTDVVIDSVAIVEQPATVGLRPLVVVPGDCRDAGLRFRWHNKTPCRAALERAADACQRRRFGAPITIEDRAAARTTRLVDGFWLDGRGNPLPTENRGGGYVRTDDGQLLPLEIRPAGPILSIR